MHEVSMAAGILRMIEEAAEREHFGRVSLMRLEIGALAGVELQALSFAITAMMPGTCMEGSELAIDVIPGTARCLHCAAGVEIKSHLDACPSCGSYTLQATGGSEVRIVDLVVFDD